jgi:hypothetical protein
MPPRQNPYGSRREPRLETGANSGPSRIAVDRDSALTAGIQGKIDLSEEHVIGYARTIAQECKFPCQSGETSLNGATDAFSTKDLRSLTVEKRYESYSLSCCTCSSRNHTFLLDQLQHEINGLSGAADTTKKLDAARSMVSAAKELSRKRFKCESFANDLNQRTSKAVLNSQMSEISMSRQSLTDSRDRLLRACELRRREINEMASLVSIMLQNGT